MSPRTVDRGARRAQLVAAASRRFAEQGVTGTSVADIVRTAGVAQGTFYLYFDSKDDVVVAVVEDVAETMLDAVRERIGEPSAAPAQRLRDFCAILANLSQDASLGDVADFIHRRENQALHDRFAEHLLPRLVPLIEKLVADGVEDGSFTVDDPLAAAWFVLGGLRGIELAGTDRSDRPAALDQACTIALRSLGAR